MSCNRKILFFIILASCISPLSAQEKSREESAVTRASHNGQNNQPDSVVRGGPNPVATLSPLTSQVFIPDGEINEWITAPACVSGANLDMPCVDFSDCLGTCLQENSQAYFVLDESSPQYGEIRTDANVTPGISIFRDLTPSEHQPSPAGPTGFRDLPGANEQGVFIPSGFNIGRVFVSANLDIDLDNDPSNGIGVYFLAIDTSGPASLDAVNFTVPVAFDIDGDGIRSNQTEIEQPGVVTEAPTLAPDVYSFWIDADNNDNPDFIFTIGELGASNGPSNGVSLFLPSGAIPIGSQQFIPNQPGAFDDQIIQRYFHVTGIDQSDIINFFDFNDNGTIDENDFGVSADIEIAIRNVSNLPSNTDSTLFSGDILADSFDDEELGGGAEEFVPFQMTINNFTDCNNDQIPDLQQLEFNDCNGNMIPDDCEPTGFLCTDCNNNFIPDNSELSGNDCNGNMIPDDCELSNIKIYDEQKLTASDADMGDQFGNKVSISGNFMAVGTLESCDAGIRCGSVYIYEFDGDTWEEKQKLTATNPDNSGRFGGSLHISGDWLAVGAQGEECISGGIGCGAVYVYRYLNGTWQEVQIITASDQDGFDYFGSAVWISSDLLVVGARGDECADGVQCGSVYTYRNSNGSWQEEQKITKQNPQNYTYFGNSVSASNNIMAVSLEESVIVFEFNGNSWQQVQSLNTSDPDADTFGGSIAINGNIIVVGAPNTDCSAGSVCGAAYVFQFDGIQWQEVQKLQPIDEVDLAAFGNSVSISDDLIVVGSIIRACDFGNSTACGGAFIFEYKNDQWQEIEKLISSDNSTGDTFGSSASLSDNHVVVGASLDDCVNGNQCGAVYVYKINNNDCNRNMIPDDCELTGNDCNGNMIPDDCELTGFQCTDCNNNFIPDNSELSGNDCNGNFIPDECDISTGFSNDIDMNGIPDECQSPMQEIIWTGIAGDSDWANALNWDPQEVPDNEICESPIPVLYKPRIGPGNFVVNTNDFNCLGDGIRLTQLTMEGLDGSNETTLNLDEFMEVTGTTFINDHARFLITQDNVEHTGGSMIISSDGEYNVSSNGNNTKNSTQNITNQGLIRIESNQDHEVGIDSQGSLINESSGDIQVRTNATLEILSQNFIQRGLLDVRINAQAFVRNTVLMNESGGEILLIGGSLDCTEGLENHGEINGQGSNIGITGDIENYGDISITGNLILDGDFTGFPGSSFVVSDNYIITGVNNPYTIQGGSLELNNTSGNTSVFIADGFDVSDSGSLRVSGQSNFTLDNDIFVTSLGSVETFGTFDGTLQARDVILGDPINLGGRIILNSNINAFVENVLIGSNGCGGGVRGIAENQFDVGGNSKLTVNKDISISNCARITVDSTESVVLRGDFINQSVDELEFDFSNGALEFDGFLGSQMFEAASRDFGPSETGFINNFVFGEIVVNSDSDVVFENTVSNVIPSGSSSPCQEVVYVDHLVLKNGSTLTLNNSKVYYHTLDDQGGTINNIGCGALLQVSNQDIGACCVDNGCQDLPVSVCNDTYVCNLFAIANEDQSVNYQGCYGDLDLDGFTTSADRGQISANLGQQSNDKICRYDMDGDGFITASDRGFISANLEPLCTPLPDYMNGSGLHNGVPDTRFNNVGVFQGIGTLCSEVICD